MEITIKKLYKGYASVRSYLVEICKKEKRPLTIKYKGEVMTILPDSLGLGKLLTSRVFKSKYDNSPYYLIDFEFRPDKERQTRLEVREWK